MNRIDATFQKKPNGILSIYVTAGYPDFYDTVPIIRELEKNGVDMIEIGIPFSDPLADGQLIQQCNQTALQNGMSLKNLFQQLESIRDTVSIPLILMGYLNPVLQYGIEAFFNDASSCGIDGFILPDLPIHEYQEQYQALCKSYNLHSIFLITPETSQEKIKIIDESGGGFVYMVSASSTTGAKEKILENQKSYFDRINKMNLNLPKLIGFGISNRQTFNTACNYANGAIIGSAFLRTLQESKNIKTAIQDFIVSIKSF